MEIRPASDRSLLVSFGGEISSDAHRQVRQLFSALGTPLPGILNLHPAFTSLLIDFDPRRRTQEEVEALVRECMLAASEGGVEPARTIEIPVSYGGVFGPDLDDVARHTGLSPERIVEMHSAARYLVYFLGFSPGFPYLGGLPPELATPRLPAPRKRVPAGSIAIGGSHAGIYPMDSPGGWRLIGRTTVRLFHTEATPPALLRTGDEVRFVAV